MSAQVGGRKGRRANGEEGQRGGGGGVIASSLGEGGGRWDGQGEAGGVGWEGHEGWGGGFMLEGEVGDKGRRTVDWGPAGESCQLWGRSVLKGKGEGVQSGGRGRAGRGKLGLEEGVEEGIRVLES